MINNHWNSGISITAEGEGRSVWDVQCWGCNRGEFFMRRGDVRVFIFRFTTLLVLLFHSSKFGSIYEARLSGSYTHGTLT